MDFLVFKPNGDELIISGSTDTTRRVELPDMAASCPKPGHRNKLRHHQRVKQALSEATVCPYCNRRYDTGLKKSIDHVVPRYSGGTDELDNLTICCTDCNTDKWTDSLAKFLARKNVGINPSVHLITHT